MPKGGSGCTRSGGGSTAASAPGGGRAADDSTFLSAAVFHPGMFGGGGLNPRKMKQMMEQMGIDLEDIDAEEVVIRTPDEDLVFTDAQVQKMDAQGQATYQVVGTPESRPRGEGASAVEGGAAGGSGDEADAEAETGGSPDIPDSDVEIVAARTGAGEDAAREALEETGGDLAAAVEHLE